MGERWIAVLAVVAAVVSGVLGGLVFSADLSPLWAVAGVVAQLLMTGLLMRWRSPVAPLAGVTVMTALLAYAPGGWQHVFRAGLTAWVPLMAAYAAARLTAEARRRLDVVLGGGALAAWIVLMIANEPLSALSILGACAPPLAGFSAALRLRLRDARRDRVAAMAREREMLARERLSGERLRMAAELHDLVTHQMVRVVFQARNLAEQSRDAGTRQAAGDIEATATTALAQMRDYVRSLTDNAAGAAIPDVDAVPVGEVTARMSELVKEESSLGREVTFEAGRPGQSPPACLVTGSAARSLLRAVQEGLANAAKHAPGVPVMIRWTTMAETATLTIENALPGGTAQHPDPLAGSGSGTGLRGLASRIQLLGGSVRASIEGGAFRLIVSVPVRTSLPEPETGAVAG